MLPTGVPGSPAYGGTTMNARMSIAMTATTSRQAYGPMSALRQRRLRIDGGVASAAASIHGWGGGGRGVDVLAGVAQRLLAPHT